MAQDQGDGLAAKCGHRPRDELGRTNRHLVVRQESSYSKVSIEGTRRHHLVDEARARRRDAVGREDFLWHMHPRKRAVGGLVVGSASHESDVTQARHRVSDELGGELWRCGQQPVRFARELRQGRVGSVGHESDPSQGSRCARSASLARKSRDFTVPSLTPVATAIAA